MIERSFKAAPANVKVPQEHSRASIRPKAAWATIGLGLGVGVLITAATSWLIIAKPWYYNPNPFTPTVASGLKFPLYYPTSVPSGYRVDSKSLGTPTAGVVIFDLKGPNGAKLYVSEEARSTTFNLGGFYEKFGHLQEIGVSDGAIAVGTLNNGQNEVASRANNNTWILANTTAKIPMSQLVTMLKSITPNP